MAEPPSIIELTNLTKFYESSNILAVDHISLSIRDGEIFAFLGPNGAGKTTTLSMLTTLLKPTEGTGRVCSYDIRKQPDQVRSSIGIVFQEPSLDGDLTGRENLELHAVLHQIPKKERKEKIQEVLKVVGLEERADLYTKNYSGGMKRRLELARGLLHRPRVLFLDEPTLGLDPQSRRAIWDKIKELNKGPDHMTIFLTTNYMDEADELADRICIIDHGKVIALDTAENLKEHLSGDVIDLRFERFEGSINFSQFVEEIRGLEGIKNVSEAKSTQNSIQAPQMKLPPGVPMPNPAEMQKRIATMMSDPTTFLKALRGSPWLVNAFSHLTIEARGKLAKQFTDEQLAQLPEPLKEVMGKLKQGEPVEDAWEEEPSLRISCVSGGKVIPQIIESVNSWGLKIKNMNLRNPTMEDVFLFFTGKAIRDEKSNRSQEIKQRHQMQELKR